VKENYNLKKFWAKKQYILDWFKLSKIVLKKNNQNYTWFNDGKINLFYNCVEKNILEKKSNKIAIITVNQKCEINKYSYLELDKKIDTFCSFVCSFFLKENIPNIVIL
jgi:acetyl-CoA synthetase